MQCEKFVNLYFRTDQEIDEAGRVEEEKRDHMIVTRDTANHFLTCIVYEALLLYLRKENVERLSAGI